MIRFLFRSLAVVFLAVAVIFAVVDVTRTIGASTLTLTPLSQSWDRLAPGSRNDLAEWLAQSAHPILSDVVLANITAWPTFAVFGGLALLIAFLAQVRRKRRTGAPRP